MSKLRYNVSIESDGRDCDGSHYSPTREEILDYTELAQTVGYATLRHGHVSTSVNDETNVTTMVFSHRHDEGFSRTCISFYELDQDDAWDDSVAGYDITTGEPIYR